MSASQGRRKGPQYVAPLMHLFMLSFIQQILSEHLLCALHMPDPEVKPQAERQRWHLMDLILLGQRQT